MARAADNLLRGNVPRAGFAVVLGVPPNTLKAAFSGRFYVGADVEARWLETSARVRDLMLAFQAGGLTFSDWSRLAAMIELKKSPEEVRAAVESLFQ